MLVLSLSSFFLSSFFPFAFGFLSPPKRVGGLENSCATIKPILSQLVVVE